MPEIGVCLRERLICVWRTGTINARDVVNANPVSIQGLRNTATASASTHRHARVGYEYRPHLPSGNASSW